MDAEGFFLEKSGGKESAARFSLEKDALLVAPQGGEALRIPLRDLASVSNTDYVITLMTRSDDGYELRRLGKRHTDMARELCLAKNELLLDDLLLRERLRRPALRCDLDLDGLKDKGEVRLYETSLVLLPDNGSLRRLHYWEVRHQEIRDFSIRLELPQGRISMQMLGKELTPLDRDLQSARAETGVLALKTVDDLCPGLPTEARRAGADLLKEGSSAWTREVQQASPELWNAIEMRLKGLGLGSSYEYLSSKAEAEWMRIGLKKPRTGEEEDYLWILAPISKGGNAIAWEAASEEGGRATYFFRIAMERGDAKGMEEDAVRKVAQGLIDVNLRREPIYLKDEQLFRPEYTPYRHACNALPLLKELRQRFIGRVMHSDEIQWAADVAEVLAFSINSRPGQRWSKAGEDAAP